MSARRFTAVAVIGGLAIAGCAKEQVTTSESTVPSTVPADPTTTTTSSTVAPPTTTEPVAATTTSSSTSTTTTTTTEPLPDIGPAPATAFAVAGNDLVELDVASGAIVRVVAEWFNADGVFRSGLQMTPDRSAAYFSEGYEDAWYGCESSVGAIGRVDLTTGEHEWVAEGIGAYLSPDGTRLAFLASHVCVPDPEAPEMWVLTPYDRVVVQDLVAGSTVELVTATPPVDYGDPNSLQWVGFDPSGDVLVLTSAGDLHRVPSTEPGVIQDHPVVLVLGADQAGGDTLMSFPYEVIGSSLLTVGVGDEGANSVMLIALDGERPAATIWESDYPVSVGASSAGHVIIADNDPAGSPAVQGAVTVIAPGEINVYSVDW